MVDIQQILRFFFSAMNAGWAQEKIEKIKTPSMPAYKAIPYREGDLYLLDNYCVGMDNEKSVGTTTIWFKNIPVWFMNYGGLYTEDAIPFLKKALRESYRSHNFFGGRGPRFFIEGKFVYLNHLRINNFDEFDGREEIFDIETGNSVGWHKYWGMKLS